MKHAGVNTLAALEFLLVRVREHAALVERTPGSFYRKSKAYLHFHEDRSGIYADVKLSGTEFTRVRATTAQEQEHLLSLIVENLRVVANEREGRLAESTLGTVKVVQVKIKPSARASVLVEESPGLWSAQLKSPPVEGKANEELIALVAKQFGCRKSAVSIKSGASGRIKLVRIED
jgi:uncharacterized protein (TIGR00251 family)